MAGFISLHREILEWEWYTDVNVKLIFIHCLLRANHDDRRWMGEIIERGSFATSIQALSAEIGISVQSVRTGLKKLESTSDLTIKGRNKFTIITVKKYDEYQIANKQITNKQQTKRSIKTNFSTNKQQDIFTTDTEKNSSDYMSYQQTNNNQKTEKSTTNNKEYNIKNINKKSTFSLLKSSFGEYKKVKLTQKQHDKLIADFGISRVNFFIQELDEFFQMKGGEKKYKDHNLTIRNWERRGYFKNNNEVINDNLFDS
jgi:hypothetical protein